MTSDKRIYQNDLSSWVPTFITTLVLLIFTIGVHYQLLPLRQAKVAFSEEDLYINQGLCRDNKGLIIKDAICDYIVPTIKNIGEAEAENIKFDFYAIPFDDISFLSGYEFFNDGIIHNLYPGASVKFGTAFIPHKTDVDKETVGKKVAFICIVNYKDSITGKEENRYFLFQYAIGNNEVSSLLWDDYDKIKQKIEKEINNPDFKKFIEEKSSIKQSKI